MGYIEHVTGIQPDTTTADDIYQKTQGTRDGAIWTADWVLARCAEGRVFVANAGTVTTPVTFGAGDIDADGIDDLAFSGDWGVSVFRGREAPR